MNQVEQVRSDIAKMMDMGAPMSDVDAYVAAHGLTPQDFNPSVGESMAQGAEGLWEGAKLGAGKLATGVIQSKTEYSGDDPATKQKADDLQKSLKFIATNLQNSSNDNKSKNPITGTIGELAPQMAVVAPFGVSLPALALGSAGLGYYSPETDPEKLIPYEGTAFERALAPVGEGVSKIVEMAGINPDSRGGRAAAGGIMGTGAYGVGKGTSALASLGNKGGKAAVRGLTKVDQAAVQALKDSGIEPTLHLTSDSFATRSIANSLEKLPLVGNRLSNSAESALNKLSGNIDDTANVLGTASNAIEGGGALQKGLRKYEQQTGDISTRNYNAVDSLIPPQTPAVTTNLQKFGSNYLDKFSDAPNIGSAIKEAPVTGVSNAILKDTAPSIIKSPILGANGQAITSVKQPQVSYNTIKNARSSLGEKAGRMDAPSEYKQLYGAASEDMKATAQGVSPDAAQAASRANNYYRALTQRNEKLKRFFTQYQDGTFRMSPEKAAEASRAELQLLKRSIPREEFNDYASSVIRKLGDTPSGVKDATGDVFSANTFFTKYDELKKSGRTEVLFDATHRAELDKAADVAARFRKLSKASNPSGTAYAGMAGGSIAGLVFAPTTTLTLGAAAYGMSRILTSPKMLKVINNYAYRPVIKNAKIRGEFSAKLLQAAGQDADLQEQAKQYVESLAQAQGGEVKLYKDGELQ
jgi:hypothetical protein